MSSQAFFYLPQGWLSPFCYKGRIFVHGLVSPGAGMGEVRVYGSLEQPSLAEKEFCHPDYPIGKGNGKKAVPVVLPQVDSEH